jgi:hypothetical protein
MENGAIAELIYEIPEYSYDDLVAEYGKDLVS